MSSLGNKEVMARNIKRLMDINEIDRNKICSDLNIKYTTFADWVNANTYPRIDKIEMMANYFHVSKAELVEEDADLRYYVDIETTKMAQSLFENKELRMLFDAAQDASPEDLETVHSMLLALKRKERDRIV